MSNTITNSETRKNQIRLFAATFFIALSSGLVFYNTEDNSVNLTNPGSRYATAEALVDQGVFYIDNVRYKDKSGRMRSDCVKIRDHFYSTKPPVLPFLLAGTYWVLKKTTGLDIRKNEKIVVRLCNSIIIGIPHVLLLIFFYKLSCYIIHRDVAVIAAMAFVSFANFGAGYSTDLNNHTLAATVLMIGFYYAYRLHYQINPQKIHWIIAGICCGLLPTLELPALFISLALTLYLGRSNLGKTFVYFLPAALVPIIVHFILTYISTQSLLPIYLRWELYNYEGSYWLETYKLNLSKDEPMYIYLFNMLIGHHGILLMNPALILSIVGIIHILKQGKRIIPETAVIFGSLVTMVLFYALFTSDYGGRSVGFRWLIVVIPLVLLYSGVWIDQCLDRKWPALVIIIIMILVIFIGRIPLFEALETPWQESQWQKFTVAIIDSMCQVVLGNN